MAVFRSIGVRDLEREVCERGYLDTRRVKAFWTRGASAGGQSMTANSACCKSKEAVERGIGNHPASSKQERKRSGLDNGPALAAYAGSRATISFRSLGVSTALS